MLLTRLHAFFNPEQFQGWGKRRNYFEGWYFKLVSAGGGQALAIIPGVAMDTQGGRHAFIQVLDGKRKTALYHRFEFDAFVPDKKSFAIRIGNNHFSGEGFEIDLPGLRGQIRLLNTVGWPKPFYSPGIMGPYSFAPFMECYHGIVSMDHGLEGSLEQEGVPVNFSGGRGYTEKDWGRSFPSAYCWMQSNHFSRPGISLKCSVARIPWIRNAFTGFIAGLWLDGKLHRFTTYNGTKLKQCTIAEQDVNIELRNPRYRLKIRAHRDEATGLAAPIRGLMEGRIEESMTARLEVELLETRSGRLIFSDTGHHAGLEVAGKTELIVTA